jgi:maleylacetoacetate isomerase
MLTLYDYPKSSACYRVRIAMAIKGIPYEKKEIHLVNDGGQQRHPDYIAKNPQGYVPFLSSSNEPAIAISQSLAILQFLEDRYPEHRLTPLDPIEKSKVLMVVHTIACDIHPINNLSVLEYLKEPIGCNDETKEIWRRHWIQRGLHVIETLLTNWHGKQPRNFVTGEQPTWAECCLIPQVYNAHRFNCDTSAFPRVMQIYNHCQTIANIQSAAPA